MAIDWNRPLRTSGNNFKVTLVHRHSSSDMGAVVWWYANKTLCYGIVRPDGKVMSTAHQLVLPANDTFHIENVPEKETKMPFDIEAPPFLEPEIDHEYIAKTLGL